MKSHESMLLDVAICIYHDTVARCIADESAIRDLMTIKSRVEHEGISFLTITLPTLGQDFERCLELGYIDSKYFLSFRKYRKIPAFLRGIFSLVFNADTGRILDDPSVEAVRAIRQLSYAFKKLKLACTPERVRKAFAGFVQDELDLSSPLGKDDVAYFGNVADCLWDWLYSDSETRIDKAIPKHGPGATAEGISGNQKYRLRSWYDRLEPYFPVDRYAFGTPIACYSQEFEEVTIVPVDQELPVRVITVPKTLKSPRIIAIEPVCMQYAQQAVSRLLISAIEKSRMAGGHVNFTDQSINQRLALIASENGLMATLDLSSASDRVPLYLVERMLQSSPDLLGAVLACRSRRAALPSGEVLSLRKFASMGSALCFPIESMYFYTLCVGALLKEQQLPVTYQNVYKTSRMVYVYGDDIVIPSRYAIPVVNFLQKYHCRVNTSKSFWNGSFRESCGVDAFRGKQVTPVYIREMPPDGRRDANAIVSWIKTANLLAEAGMSETSHMLFNACEQILGSLPIIGPNCAGLGRVSYQRFYPHTRVNKNTQSPEIRAWVAGPVYRKDKLTGYAALMKCLLNLEHRDSPGYDSENRNVSEVDQQHLMRSARHGSVALKRRWIQPF